MLVPFTFPVLLAYSCSVLPPNTAWLCCLLPRAVSMPQEGERRKREAHLGKTLQLSPALNSEFLPIILMRLLNWPQPVSLKVRPCPTYYIHEFRSDRSFWGASSSSKHRATRGKWMGERSIVRLCNAIIVAQDRGIWCCAGHKFMCEASSIDLWGLSACWRCSLCCATSNSLSRFNTFKANNFLLLICQWMRAI